MSLVRSTLPFMGRSMPSKTCHTVTFYVVLSCLQPRKSHLRLGPDCGFLSSSQAGIREVVFKIFLNQVWANWVPISNLPSFIMKLLCFFLYPLRPLTSFLSCSSLRLEEPVAFGFQTLL
jgi:hypothetical protein